MACYVNFLIETEGLLKVTYIVKVVISRKRCKIDTFLLLLLGCDMWPIESRDNWMSFQKRFFLH